MVGREISRKYFKEVVYPILKEFFSKVINNISVGLIGMGSEVLGFDDEISHDHNFCPRSTIFIDDNKYNKWGKQIKELIEKKSPKKYMGYTLLKSEYCKFIEVVPLKKHFLKYLNITNFPKSDLDWLKLDEQKLLELVSCTIFYDPNGMLKNIIDKIRFYPKKVRAFLLYQCFVRMSEVEGIERSIKRRDVIATELYKVFFVYFAIKAFHLIKGTYCPYRKWMGRSLENLDRDGGKMGKLINSLVKEKNLQKIREKIKNTIYFITKYILPNPDLIGDLFLTNQKSNFINTNWNLVYKKLKKEAGKELFKIPSVISQRSYWGLIFDMDGLGYNFKETIKINLDFILNK